ncbi:MAG: alpha-galactosidase [Massiliimalia sp.]|jgi:alpha-galactosidase
MIQIDEKRNLFTLQTKHSTYQMKVDQYGFLLHTYYGSTVEDIDLSYTICPADRGFSGNPYEAENNRSYSLDTFPQEYSTFGRGDYRSSALYVVNSDGSYDCDLRYCSYEIIKGKPALPGLPATYGTEDEVETLKITLQDPVTKLTVELSYSVFADRDMITRSAVITNHGDTSVKLEKALSCCVDFQVPHDMDVMTFYGKHCHERGVERTPVRHGKIVVDSVRGASSHHQNPFVILCDHKADETHGNCYGFSFVYSGNFVATTELDQIDQVRFTMGIHSDGFEFTLQPEEQFQTPEVVMAYSEQGLGQLSRNYHKLYQNNLCRGKYKHARRPILINNWEATYFQFDDDKLVKIAEDASKLGIEMLVMDDGWFGKRDDDNSGLGDWFVNTNKIKGGLDHLCKRINDLGMKFGIWFEPEMISEDSDLYRAHPDWCLCTQGRKGTRSRYQFVLDMSRDDVIDYLYKVISDILDSANIEYVKWDMNRHMANVWSAQLPAERQGEVYHRYILGLYRLLERLTSAYPDVLFEGCSGGGGRFDAGMLYYSPQIWCSDNTDAIERLDIQYGTSFGYPVSAMGAHVSACPNHQTGRISPLYTRGVVAMSGTFGYELDINKMTPREKEIVKEQVETFKSLYDLISYGDYYRLSNPFEEKEYTAWMFVSEDKTEALVNYVQVRARSNASVRGIFLEGLDDASVYQVNGMMYVGEEETKLPVQELSGSALKKAGLMMPMISGDYTSVQYQLKKVR